jgi:hypothetical protein
MFECWLKIIGEGNFNFKWGYCWFSRRVLIANRWKVSIKITSFLSPSIKYRKYQTILNQKIKSTVKQDINDHKPII